jgi:hypothetical protein
MTDWKNLVFTWSAAYSNSRWALNKHFIVTLQRNVGGGMAGARGGGCLEIHGQVRTFKDIQSPRKKLAGRDKKRHIKSKKRQFGKKIVY